MTTLLLLSLLVTFAMGFARPPLRITCIGDSITQGSTISPCGSLSYVTLLQERLGKEHFKVFNAGNSSKTMSRGGKCRPHQKGHMQTICSYWNTINWRQALGSSPDIVTVMLGTNDAKTFNWYTSAEKRRNTFAVDFKFMLMRLLALSPAPHHIFVMTPSPVTTNKLHIDRHVIEHVLPPLLQCIVGNVTAYIDKKTTTAAATTTAASTPTLTYTMKPKVELVDIHHLFSVHSQFNLQTQQAEDSHSQRMEGSATSHSQGHSQGQTQSQSQAEALVCPQDGVHLTPAGNALIAETLFGLISRLNTDND
jgi:lysophospholipase L1-like esterase